MPTAIKCENCGTTMGGLEDAFVWLDRPVCEACHTRLAARSKPSSKPMWFWFAIAGAAATVALAIALVVVLLTDRSQPKPLATTLPAAKELHYEYQTYAWKAGDQPLKMIHKDEGFCMLTGINGAFNGGGEGAGVVIKEDGYWYLEGGTGQGFLRLTAVSVKRV